MFIYDFIQVDVPFADVRDHLLHGGGAWLSQLATAACEGEQYPAARISVRPAEDLPVSKQVVVEIDEPYENDGLVRVPFRWRATGPSALFPTLEGDIELAHLGHCRTHICVMGRYNPPLGSIGRVLDRIVLHHFAEGTIRSFLKAVAEDLVGAAAVHTATAAAATAD
jgi:hypothetical protein